MKRQISSTEVLESSVALNTIDQGNTFRFAHMSREDAIKEDLFWMVCSTVKDSRVSIVNVFDGSMLVRDASQRVIAEDIGIVLNGETK